MSLVFVRRQRFLDRRHPNLREILAHRATLSPFRSDQSLLYAAREDVEFASNGAFRQEFICACGGISSPQVPCARQPIY